MMFHVVLKLFKTVLKSFSTLKYRSNEVQMFVESFKKRELKLLGYQAKNLQYSNFPKRCLDLIADSILTKLDNKKSCI